MPPKDLLIDLADVDFNHVVADLDEIRKYNPQRFEMEQLTAIVYDDVKEKICVGKIFHLGRLPVNMQLGAYWNVVAPDNGPDWQLRFQVQFMFPK